MDEATAQKKRTQGQRRKKTRASLLSSAALTEAAIAVMEADNDTGARSEAIELISRLLPPTPLPEHPSSTRSNIIN